MKRLATLVVGMLLVCGCAGGGKATDGTPTAPNPTLKAATFKIGQATISAELALTADQRERGLMFRKELADGKGMLFVFDNDQVLEFWMKNTELPLSIAWIGSDGIVKGISNLKPQSLDAMSSERSVRYALEAPAGWFDRAGVKVGDRVEVPPLN